MTASDGTPDSAAPPARDARAGVLLVNLGTPDAPTPQDVRAYLAEFLSDRRVIDYPRALWLPVLYGIILNVRPAKTARAYREIWRTDTDESPLRYFTRRQAARLGERLRGEAHVGWAMRYGAPSVAAGLAALKERGARGIVVLPLYPQYSFTTTASVEDAVRAADAGLAVAIAPSFHDSPAYIGALSSTLARQISALEQAPERVVLSFHSLPERLIRRGDPYLDHCRGTAALLRAALGWTEEFAPIAFQSTFGPEKWIGPSTEETLARLAGAGIKSVAVAAPGFVADCIETLEEIAIRARETFLTAGGEAFTALPCLNDTDEAIALLESLARDALARRDG